MEAINTLTQAGWVITDEEFVPGDWECRDKTYVELEKAGVEIRVVVFHN